MNNFVFPQNGNKNRLGQFWLVGRSTANHQFFKSALWSVLCIILKAQTDKQTQRHNAYNQMNCQNFNKLQREEQFNYLLNSDGPIVRNCYVGSTTTQRMFLVFCFFFILAPIDYNSTVTVGHYEPAPPPPPPPPPRVANTISYLLAVDRSHVSEIHEGKIGNVTTPAPLISFVDFFQ